MRDSSDLRHKDLATTIATMITDNLLLQLQRCKVSYYIHSTSFAVSAGQIGSGLGNRVCNIQYIDNILQYMRYYNISLPEANIAIYGVSEANIAMYMVHCAPRLQYIATLLNMATIYCNVAQYIVTMGRGLR